MAQEVKEVKQPESLKDLLDETDAVVKKAKKVKTMANGDDRKAGSAAKRAAKRPSKPVVVKPNVEHLVQRASKPSKKAKGAKEATKVVKKGKTVAKATRARGDGEYSRAVLAAVGKLKAMKPGTSATTRELAEKYDLKPWAFKAAGHKLEAEQMVKMKNADRTNTITRLK